MKSGAGPATRPAGRKQERGRAAPVGAPVGTTRPRVALTTPRRGSPAGPPASSQGGGQRPARGLPSRLPGGPPDPGRDEEGLRPPTTLPACAQGTSRATRGSPGTTCLRPRPASRHQAGRTQGGHCPPWLPGRSPACPCSWVTWASSVLSATSSETEAGQRGLERHPGPWAAASSCAEAAEGCTVQAQRAGRPRVRTAGRGQSPGVLKAKPVRVAGAGDTGIGRDTQATVTQEATDMPATATDPAREPAVALRLVPAGRPGPGRAAAPAIPAAGKPRGIASSEPAPAAP